MTDEILNTLDKVLNKIEKENNVHHITRTYDLTSKILEYETEGFDTEEEYLVFYQALVDKGLAWQLQGHYGRTALALIEAGLIDHG